MLLDCGELSLPGHIPVGALHERLHSLRLAITTAHLPGVHRERGFCRRVPHSGHHVGGVSPIAKSSEAQVRRSEPGLCPAGDVSLSAVAGLTFASLRRAVVGRGSLGGDGAS